MLVLYMDLMDAHAMIATPINYKESVILALPFLFLDAQGNFPDRFITRAVQATFGIRYDNICILETKTSTSVV